jgi:hypothetical protein
MEKHRDIVELCREHLSGEEKGIEEVLLLQALSGSQGGSPIDPTVLILLLAGTGRKRGGRFENLALLAILLQQQQQAQAAACSTTGVPVSPTTSNPLLALLALGILDRPKVAIREFPVPPSGVQVEEKLDELQEEICELKARIALADETDKGPKHPRKTG